MNGSPTPRGVRAPREPGAAAAALLAREIARPPRSGARKPDLLEVTDRCHPQTVHRTRSCKTMPETLSVQIPARM
jgi:hypothetical protein